MIEEKYWQKLRAMLEYLRAYIRPDGRAPLVGDTDSGQVLPIIKRGADDHASVLAIGASLFSEPRFKIAAQRVPQELLWMLGAQGVRDYENLETTNAEIVSQAFRDAGTYVMRQDDLYLLCNTSGAGLYGRGSHGHNDALSIEVSACGTSFIVDPGTYVYSANLRERHLFRSTAYHSTVEVDGAEQSTINEGIPFVIGDEAQPHVISWETTPERDTLVAEHDGYARLSAPVTHRRTVCFLKRERFWTVEDTLTGQGAHDFRFRFHFRSGLEVSARAERIVQACDKMNGATLLVAALDLDKPPILEARFQSRDYGEKTPSVSACWAINANAPSTFKWAIVPVCASDDAEERLEFIGRLKPTPDVYRQ